MCVFYFEQAHLEIKDANSDKIIYDSFVKKSY